jgi:hypothetical protein
MHGERSQYFTSTLPGGLLSRMSAQEGFRDFWRAEVKIFGQIQGAEKVSLFCSRIAA